MRLLIISDTKVQKRSQSYFGFNSVVNEINYFLNEFKAWRLGSACLDGDNIFSCNAKCITQFFLGNTDEVSEIFKLLSKSKLSHGKYPTSPTKKCNKNKSEIV